MEAEKKKGDGAADGKKPASWRWEKQELEKQIKEQKKKLDDMHEELKRQQFKWKMAGDDLARVCNVVGGINQRGGGGGGQVRCIKERVT